VVGFWQLSMSGRRAVGSHTPVACSRGSLGRGTLGESTQCSRRRCDEAHQGLVFAAYRAGVCGRRGMPHLPLRSPYSKRLATLARRGALHPPFQAATAKAGSEYAWLGPCQSQTINQNNEHTVAEDTPLAMAMHVCWKGVWEKCRSFVCFLAWPMA